MVIGFCNARFYDIEGRLLPEGRKGFKRRDVYGKLEIDFVKAVGKEWLKKMGIIHEQPFKGSVKGTYHVDFYLASKRIAIETDPEFHTSYKPVAVRDIRRDDDLLNIHNVVTLRITPRILYNPEAIEYVKAMLERAPKSLNTIDGWI